MAENIKDIWVTKPISSKATADPIMVLQSRNTLVKYVWCQEGDIRKSDLATLCLSPVMVKYLCILRPHASRRADINDALNHIRMMTANKTDEQVLAELLCEGNASIAFDKCHPKAIAFAEILWLWKRELQAWEQDRSKDADYQGYYEQLVADMNKLRNAKEPQARPYQMSDILAKFRKGPDVLPPGLIDASCEAHGETPNLEICNRLWNVYFFLKQEGLSGGKTSTPGFIKDNMGARYGQAFPDWWHQIDATEDLPHPLDLMDQERLKDGGAPSREFKGIKCTAMPMPYKMFVEREDVLVDAGDPVPKLPSREVDIEDPRQHPDLADWRDHLRATLLLEEWCFDLDSIVVQLRFDDPEKDRKLEPVLTTERDMTYEQLFECLEEDGLSSATFRVNIIKCDKTKFERPRVPLAARKYLYPDGHGDVAMETQHASILTTSGENEPDLVDEEEDQIDDSHVSESEDEENGPLQPQPARILAQPPLEAAEEADQGQEVSASSVRYRQPSVEDVPEDEPVTHSQPIGVASDSKPVESTLPPNSGHREIDESKDDYASLVEHPRLQEWLSYTRERAGRDEDTYHELATEMRRLCMVVPPDDIPSATFPQLPRSSRGGKNSGPRPTAKDGVKKMNKAMRDNEAGIVVSDARLRQGKKQMENILRVSKARHGRLLGQTESKYSTRSLPHLYKPTSLSAEQKDDRFGRDYEQFIKEEYDGFDVISDKRQLIKWMRHAIDNCVGQGRHRPKERSLDQSTTIAKDVSKACKVLDAGLRADSLRRDADAKVNADDEGVEATPETVRNRDVEAAMFGASGHAGPQLDLCLELLGMEKVGQHGEMAKYSSEKYMPECKIPLLPTQITGMVHMLWRTLGHFPLSAKQKEEQDKFDRILAQLAYDSPLTRGGILGDSPGMGKTYTTLAFFNWYMKHAEHVDEHGKPDHRPSLLVAPEGVVFHQWVEAASKMFQDITLVVCKPGDPWPRVQDGSKLFTYLSSTQTKQPLEEKSGFPKGLEYMFNKEDERASKVLIMAPYRTWVSRAVTLDDAPEHEQETDPENGKRIPLDANERAAFERKGIDRLTNLKLYQCPFYKGRVKMVMCDEGHTIRTPTTHGHWSIRGLEADITWLLTATPVIQHAPELADLARLFWPSISKELRRDPKFQNVEESFNVAKTITKGIPNYAPWQAIEALITEQKVGPNDRLQLMRLEPNILRYLLESKDLKAIAKNFQYFDNMLTLRRSPESSLPNSKGPSLSLKSIMRDHTTLTTDIAFEPGPEEVEHLYWHRRASLKYEELCQLQRNKSRSKRHSVPPVSGPLRHMNIAASSNLLSRFERHITEFTDGDTLVTSLKIWREANLDADLFLKMTCEGDGLPHRQNERPSRAERLKKLTEGSPKLREILRHIRDYVLPDPEQKGPLRFKKLLITEDLPLVAWFWELALNFLHVHTQVLESELEDHEREFICEEFNSPPAPDDIGHLTVLILMYTINASGVNLDRDCNRCIVSTAASSAPLEIQAWSRLIRVSQQKDVEIFRLCVRNSHDEWREASQASKALFDTATKAFSGDTKETLAKLLNTSGRKEIEEVKNTPLGQAIQGIFDQKLFGDDKAHHRQDLFETILKKTAEEKLGAGQVEFVPDTPSAPEFSPMDAATVQLDSDLKGSTAGNVDPTINTPSAPETENSPSKSMLAPPASEQEFSPNEAMSKFALTMEQKGKDSLEERYEDDMLEESRPLDDIPEEAPEEDERDLQNEARLISKAGSIFSQDILNTPWKARTLDGSNRVLAASKDYPTTLDRYIPDHLDMLESGKTIASRWRTHFSKMTSTERSHFDQDILYTLFVIQIIEPGQVHTADEMEDIEGLTFERALRLLHRHRFGQDRPKLRITPHLDYTPLNNERGLAVMAKVKHETCRRDLIDSAEKFGFTMKSMQAREAETAKEKKMMKEIIEDMGKDPPTYKSLEYHRRRQGAQRKYDDSDGDSDPGTPSRKRGKGKGKAPSPVSGKKATLRKMGMASRTRAPNRGPPRAIEFTARSGPLSGPSDLPGFRSGPPPRPGPFGMFSGPAKASNAEEDSDSDIPDGEAAAKRQNWLREAKVEQEVQDRQNREEGMIVEDAADSGDDEFGSVVDFEEV